MDIHHCSSKVGLNMKQLLTAYANYELWANEQMLAVVLDLTEEQQKQEIPSSFPSIHKTCSHMWDASRIWWQRLQHEKNIMGPTINSNYPIKEVVDNMLKQNKLWADWVGNASEADINAVLDYQNMKGDPFSQPMREILLHLTNHGTYHRGQLVTMLRQVGVEKIPQTDYILYSRL